MKHISYIQKVFAPVLIGLAVLITGCNDLTQPEPAQTTPETAGAVNVRIQIAGADTSARTLLATSPSEFTQVTLTCEEEGKSPSPPVSRDWNEQSPDISLGVGTWTIYAKAYTNFSINGTPIPAATAVRKFKIVPRDYTPADNEINAVADTTNQGNLVSGQDTDPDKIDIFWLDSIGSDINYPNTSTSATVKITLKSGVGEGKGQFEYTITFRSGNFQEARLQMFKINDNQVSSTPAEEVNLTSPLPTTSRTEVTRSDSILLDAGYYLLKISMNGRIVKSEVVHIFSGLTTSTTNSGASDRDKYIFYDGEFQDVAELNAYLSSAVENTPDTPYWIKLHGLSSAPTLPTGKYVYLDLKDLPENTLNTQLSNRPTLVGVKLPNGASISPNAFKGCTALTSVEFPNNLTTIGNSAFEGCTALTTLPNTVQTIGDYAFKGCTALASVTLPPGLNKIGHYAFQNCTNLKVTFSSPANNGQNLEIGVEAFKNTGRSIEVNLAGYNTINGWDAYPSDNTGSMPNLLSKGVFQNSGLVGVTLPASLTKIGDYAFQNCDALDSPTLPASLTKIGDYAFQNCTLIRRVIFPSSLEEIGTQAFKATGLIAVNLSGNTRLSLTESGIFADCGSLTAVTFPDPVGNSPATFIIGSVSFKNCTALEQVILPDYVNRIDAAAFDGCTNLTSITCQATTPPSLGGLLEFPSTAIIYVPQGSLTDYETAWSAYWSQIQPIIP
jgi:hypothetical protein